MTDLGLDVPSLAPAAGSDIVAPQSGLTSPAGDFSVDGIAENLSRIRAVERVWRLPALPDEVKFDLAAEPGMNPDVLGEFLAGIDGDLHEESEQEEIQPQFQAAPALPAEPGLSGAQQLRIISADLFNEKKPTDPDPRAVSKFKLDAINRGFLAPPPSGTVDDRWSPELNGVMWEMAQDDRNRMFRGEDQIDSVSTNQALDLLARVTQPGYLLSAATELDLLPDVGNILSETTNWVDKWRKVGESKNPLDFGKNLLDAALGPIDDIAMPVITWAAVIGTGGVGGLALGSLRGATLGAKAFQGGQALRGLQQARGAAALAQPSMTANRLAREAGGATQALDAWRAGGAARSALSGPQAAGAAMAAWRGYKPVRVAKRTLQAPMRAGLLAQGQDLVPGYQGGYSLADIPGVSNVQQPLEAFSDSFASLPLELMFAPQNIFNPGTFVGKGSAAKRALEYSARALGSRGGAAAVGGTLGVSAGVLLGDDLQDTATGGVLGAVAGVGAAPAGRLIKSSPTIASSLTGGLVGGGLGAIASLDPVDPEGQSDWWQSALTGAAAGATILGSKSAVFKRPGNNKLVGFVADGLEKSRFTPVVGDGQKLTMGIHEALYSTFGDFRKAVGESDGTFVDSYRRWAGNPNMDERQIAAEVMSWVTSYTIHKTATLAAGGETDEFLDAYNLVKGRLLGAFRQFDLADDSHLIEVAAHASAAPLLHSADDFGAYGDKVEEMRVFFRDNPLAAKELASKHNAMGSELFGQMFAMETLSDLGQTTRGMEAQGFLQTVRSDPGEGLAGLGDFIRAHRDSVGHWDQYSTNQTVLNQLEEVGLLDGSTFVDVNLPWGGSRPAHGNKTLVSRAAADLTGGILSETARAVKNGDDGPILSPWLDMLGNVTPTGRFTLARKTTITKQVLEEQEEVGKQFSSMYAAIDTARARVGGEWAATLDEATRAASSDAALEAAVKRLAQQTGSNDVAGFQKGMRRLVKEARRRGWSLTELEKKVDAEVTEWLDNNPRWGDLLGGKNQMSSYLEGEKWVDSGSDVGRRKLVQHRRKQLHRRAQYTAAEVDVDAQIARLEEAGFADEAAQVRRMKEDADEAGYRLVHGVDYMMPSELARSEMFEDINRLHMNAMTLGNWFKGRVPAVARANLERRQRWALLEKLQARGLDEMERINPETGVREVVKIGEDDEWLGGVVADLYGLLRRRQAFVKESIDSLPTQSGVSKIGTRLQSTDWPKQVADLGGYAKEGKWVRAELMNIGYTPEQTAAIWDAIPKFRNAEFRDVGLYALESGLRERKNLVDGLKFLGGMGNNNTRAGVAGGIAGAYAGMATGAGMADTEGEVRGNQLIGGLIGGAAGLAGGTAAKGVVRAGLKAGDGKVLNWAEHTRYAYMADGLARARDTFRFALSPIFDLSRYTEGYMLGQIAAPLRNADGSRFIMPADVSPTGVARRHGAGRFQEWMEQFQNHAVSGKDFDPQELDSMGRWFADVGILGFNPTNWMGAAFGELRAAGMSVDDAYRHARGMYTYGVNGRSAAEMSLNFVLFPFSFQKKAYTHLAKWMTDDLSRSLLLHDANKAYEEISKELDLGEFWEEHVPVLKQLRRLNLFAYGLSLGQVGGVNKNLLDAPVSMATELGHQLFTPQAFSVKDAYDAAEVMDSFQRLMPAINDIEWMVRNVHDQGQVLANSDAGFTTNRGTVSLGWSEWNDYKTAVEEDLESAGYTWSDMHSKPWLQDYKMAVEAKRAEIAAKYPEWRKRQAEGIGNSIAMDMERKDRINRVLVDPATATSGDFQLAKLDQLLDDWKVALSYQGMDIGRDGWQAAPPEVWRAIKEEAVAMRTQNPNFVGIWEKFFADQFGPLEYKIA